jgi:predicted ATP-grasp superfamily ATP-dependent carboligase
MLGLLTLPLPLNLAWTVMAVARESLRGGAKGGREAVPEQKRTILVSGGKMTKALLLARSFHRAGHRVILVESTKYRQTGHRFSNAVDRFYTVPEPAADGYAEALLEIVWREGVDVFVPVSSPAAARYDARAKRLLAPHCEVLHCDSEVLEKLDDKDTFAATATSLGLPVPDTHRVTTPQQVVDFDFGAHPAPYVLKSIPYDPVHRMDLTHLPLATRGETAAFAAARTMSETVPWILQEFVAGAEYCTHSTVREGRLQLHCCCRSSAFQINYEPVDKPEIEAWVRHFVGALGVTGQVSFDFIQAEDGQLYAIECNPRTHSAITMFYDHPGVAAAYLESGAPVVRPLRSSRPTYWIYHEVWRLLTQPAQAAGRLKVIFAGKDAIFDWADPLPFLLVHHLQIPSLLLRNLRRGKDWVRIDFNIGKLVEAAGD